MINIKKKQIESIVKKILNLFTVQDFNSVISQCKKNIRIYPTYTIFYNILGNAYMNIGSYHLAKETLEKIQKTDPNNISIMNNLANIEKNLFNFSAAKKLFIKIIELKPDYLNAYVNYGNLERDLNNFNQSIELHKKALKINNKHPVVLYSLAMNYQALGDFKKSTDYALKALESDSKFTRADLLISKSKKYEPNEKHLIQMESKIQNLELNKEQIINLYFAIGKAYEDIDNIEKCYKNIKSGNDLKKELSNFDINKEIKLFDDIKKTFSQIKFPSLKKNYLQKNKIIFILGMPRSGTTLVEQIISSHSQVYGSGELPYISKIISDEVFMDSRFSSNKFLEIINDNSSNNPIADKYFSYLKNYEIEERFITDKAPLNFRWIGLIKIFFPSSTIIHCSRSPKDNCLSLYKNLFEGGLNFSYNENDLAIYYNLYLDLMLFWEKNIPGSFLKVKYEDLITKKETEIKKIIKYCNLEWEEECLNFNKNKNPIKTVSTAQARSPIYNSSIESYKKLQPYLKNLFNIVKV